MRKTIKRLIVSSVIPIFLTGCWDQRLLKEQKLISLVGYDMNSNGEVIASMAYPVRKGGVTTGTQSASSQSTILTTHGKTALDSLMHADLKISERIDISKAQVILFGEKIAKVGLYQVIDHIYRNPKGALGAKVAIVEGSTAEAVNLKQEEAEIIGRYYDEFLKSGRATGFYTNYNVQSVCPLLLKHTKDPLLPLLQIQPTQNRAVTVGMAMFNNEKMTGKLNIDESKMFILLDGSKKQKVSLLVRTNNHYKNRQKNYVVIEVLGTKPKTKLHVKNKSITADLSLKLYYRITEYPKNHLTTPMLLDELNKAIKENLTQLAQQTITKMQEANCDGFGIEEQIKVHHHKLWEKQYKNTALKNITIKPRLQLELTNSGIID
ncbi:Ger(x)C family spore germination protein [Neobacillus kokaensis]|uniref:Germination protein n=1 Tax=Neobacillus kokaensis TaxID=2759023 RepID=A0ABQ3N4J3_9BACI|nr:Ger(x)C family spore germination protein [Neobacillus kokaensis]GHH99848.1 germination protein [Neobacillus kokaensis]